MIVRTLSMSLVRASDNLVVVECGRCLTRHRLESGVYQAKMRLGRRFECPVCLEVGRLPDRRYHDVPVEMDRREQSPPAWASADQAAAPAEGRAA